VAARAAASSVGSVSFSPLLRSPVGRAGVGLGGTGSLRGTPAAATANTSPLSRSSPQATAAAAASSATNVGVLTQTALAQHTQRHGGAAGHSPSPHKQRSGGGGRSAAPITAAAP